MTLALGNLKLAKPILQSPMAGCTDLAYRKIARRFGCELAFCEMVKDRPIVERGEKTMQMVRTAPWDHPVGMQLFGREPGLLAEAAKVLEGLGADVVDLNLGCPVNKIVSQACGSALLKEPAQVARILDAMVPAVKVPVTIKMRTGFDDGDDARFLEIARLAERAGAAAITVHGRTRQQGYKGTANFAAIAAVKSTVSIPVIGNGDIRRGADAARMTAETKCDGVMLARGALGNPWIYREVAAALAGEPAPNAPTVAERRAVLREHFDLLRELHGDRTACLRIRKVAAWFIGGASGARELRNRLNAVATPDAFCALLSGSPKFEVLCPMSTSQKTED